MLQIIGYLLCIYLVFKGVEIFQTAFAATPRNRQAIALGALAVIAAVAIGLGFAVWLSLQSAAVDMPKMPDFRMPTPGR